jgi:ABC-type transporter Mla MlaB component
LERSGATIDDKRNIVTGTLDYEDALRMALDIGAQLEAAESEGKGYIRVSLDDIRRMDSGSYIIMNENVYGIKSGKLTLTKPFTYTEDMAPELASVSKLPAKVPASVGYYSLAKTVIKALDISNDIERLNPTKLYYLLKRAIETKPEDRYFLYI